MLSIVEGLLVFVAVSESILGILGNGFIGVVSCIDCVKSKKISTVSLILTGLASSRFCLIWIIITDTYVRMFFPDIYLSGNLIQYIAHLWIIMSQSSVWFATSLSIFYFLKIANYSHCVFLWLTGHINRVLLLFMVCLLISWLFAFASITKPIINNIMKNRSTTWLITMHKSEYLTNQILLNIGVILVFVLCLITCFLLITSLWRHNRKMQFHATGFRDPSTEAHIKAIKILVSFIILFILYFVGTAIQISVGTIPENKLLLIVGITSRLLYPWGHSLILILGNRKLKQDSLRVLKPLKCWEKEKLLRIP
ncbi:taste receptor type 2 member 10-like [Moschus berezovskii]|uniref:taste receptor type 2 member 10-like n=1 Tax=Moschus berezovskii TaxID=68408 RepID=UPI002444D8DA|nr:taste receptor type 2 member 10-like [Moschus berezovskii]